MKMQLIDIHDFATPFIKIGLTAASPVVGRLYSLYCDLSDIRDKQTFQDLLSDLCERVSLLEENQQDYISSPLFAEEIARIVHDNNKQMAEWKRDCFTNYFTKSCIVASTEVLNKNKFLDMLLKLDILDYCILKNTPKTYSPLGVQHLIWEACQENIFDADFESVQMRLELLQNNGILQSYTTEELQERCPRFGRFGSRDRLRRPFCFYKRTILGDKFYDFISKDEV